MWLSYARVELEKRRNEKDVRGESGHCARVSLNSSPYLTQLGQRPSKTPDNNSRSRSARFVNAALGSKGNISFAVCGAGNNHPRTPQLTMRLVALRRT